MNVSAPGSEATAGSRGSPANTQLSKVPAGFVPLNVAWPSKLSNKLPPDATSEAVPDPVQDDAPNAVGAIMRPRQIIAAAEITFFIVFLPSLSVMLFDCMFNCWRMTEQHLAMCIWRSNQLPI